MSDRPRVHVLHENPEWFPPFARAFEAEGIEVVEWLLTDGVLDLDAETQRLHVLLDGLALHLLGPAERLTVDDAEALVDAHLAALWRRPVEERSR